MPRRIVEDRGRSYTIASDDPPPLGGRWWALVRARVTDEMTGLPPVTGITLESDTLRAVPRVGSDGLVGLVGIPQQVFPNLAGQGYPVIVTVQTVGYLPQTVPFAVPQDNTFPATFSPPPLVEVALHREPVVLYGRTVRALNGATTPLSGATVRLTGLWRTPPPANVAVAPDPPNIAALQPPLYAARAAATGRLRRRNLPVVAGDDKTLLDGASAGASRLRLSNRQNLNIGTILRIDADSPDLTEYLAVNDIAGASTPDQPAVVTFDYPLQNAHRRHAVARRVTLQPLGPDRPFTVDALPGDTTVFLNSLAGLTAGDQVRVTGGAVPDEYHDLLLYNVTSDAEGYYRLPPLSRVAQVQIRAESGALTPVDVEYRPDYALRENRLDLIFR